jgi:hypothetical protein
MNEDTDRRQESPGRIVHTTAHGDNAEEIELSALDQARAFFGPDRRLAVIPDYQAYTAKPGQEPEPGKRYTAGVRVRTVEDGQS